MKEEKESLVQLIEKVIRELLYKNKIQRYDNLYITLKSDKQDIMYCSVCWDKDRNLIQVDKRNDGSFFCHNCKQNSYYDEKLVKTNNVIELSKEINDFISYDGRI